MKDTIGTHLVALSANSEDELNTKLKRLSKYLSDCRASNIPLIDVCSSINISPETIKNSYRAVAVGKTYDEIINKIDDAELIRGVAAKNPPKLCFLYSGYGVLYPKMSFQFYKTSPVFRNYVDMVEEEIIQVYEKNNKMNEYKSFQEIVYSDKHLLDDPQESMSVNMRLGFILHKIWEYWGIVPDVVLGSSVGEYSAVCGAGFVRYQDSIRQFTEAVGLLKHHTAKGGMFVLMLDKEATERMIADFLKTVSANTTNVWIDVAVVNCAMQTVVSMSEESIPLFIKYCTSKKIKSTRLNSTNTFHSRGIVGDVKLLNDVMGNSPSYSKRCDYISSLTGNLMEELDNTKYWGDLIRSQVNFQKACHTAYNYGARTFIEIGPHPVQAAIMAMNVEEVGSEPITCLPSLQKNQDDWTTLMTTFATLYTQGYSTNWYGIYAKYSRNKVNTPFHDVELPKQISQIGPPQILSSENGKKSLKIETVTNFIIEEVKKILQKSGQNVSLETISKSNFLDLGLSSLQIVLMKNQLQQAFGENFPLQFSDFLDVTNVVELSERICSKIEMTAKGLEHELELAEIARAKAQVRKDMHLPKHIKRPNDDAETCQLKDIKTILVTGATGNLCPFLIEWLLTKRNRKTEKLYVMIRGKDGMQRMLKKFEFLEIDATKLDLSKIEVVKGNITESLLGMDKKTYDRLAEECDAIVNSAASTNHLAKYSGDDTDPSNPRFVNVTGTLHLLEFACHKRLKWLYNASTAMSVTCTKGIYYEQWPEEWPHKGLEGILDSIMNIGYMISKSVSDYLIYKGTKRGIPAKVFRFPKIGNCKDVTNNHFIAKFLHYLISGTIPQFDIPLQILSVRDCANLSMTCFFDKTAPPCDIYNVVSPYDISEMDLAVLGKELGPKLRFMVDAVRLNSAAFGPDTPAAEARKENLTKVIKQLDDKYGAGWLDDPSKALEDPIVEQLLSTDYKLKMKYVDYNEFIGVLGEMKMRSPLYPWMEFYNAYNSIYSRFNQRNVTKDLPFGFLNHGASIPHTYLRNLKLERLYPEKIFDMIEKPLDVVRTDVMYAILNAKHLFAHPY